MQIPQEAAGLIDYRELIELLPNADEDALASEFITGRVTALTRNAGGGLDARDMPMVYDADRDAWSIDRAGAREGRYLFRLADVKALAGRHPKWTPLPEPYVDPDRLPEWVWRQNSDFHTVSAERDRLALYAGQLEEDLQTALATVERLKTELAGATAKAEQAPVLKAENERLRQECDWYRNRQKGLCKAGAEQEAELEEQRRRVAELQAELATAKATPCIGDGLLRIACDFRREGMDRDIMATKLYDCQYKPSYGVVRCLVSTPSELAGDVKFPAEGNDAVSNRRTASGKTMVNNGKEKLNRPG